MKEDNLIPEDYNDFTSKYLNNNGDFTENGEKEYLNDISGYISYLNRGKDARSFAYPIFTNIEVELSKSIDNKNNIDQETLIHKCIK